MAKEIPSTHVRPIITSIVGTKNKIKVTVASELDQSYNLTLYNEKGIGGVPGVPWAVFFRTRTLVEF